MEDEEINTIEKDPYLLLKLIKILTYKIGLNEKRVEIKIDQGLATNK